MNHLTFDYRRRQETHLVAVGGMPPPLLLLAVGEPVLKEDLRRPSGSAVACDGKPVFSAASPVAYGGKPSYAHWLLRRELVNPKGC